MLQLKSKKLIFLFCFLGLFISETFSFTNGDYQSAASGNWSAPGTWQKFVAGAWAVAGANPAPTSTDLTITILSGHTVTFDASISVDQLIINSGGVVNVNSGVIVTIVNGAADLTINAGGTLSNSGTIILNLLTASANSGTFTNGGTVSVYGAFTNNSLIFTNNAAGKINIENTGILTNAAGKVIANNGLINVKTGSTFTNSSATVNAVRNYSGSVVINSGTITPGVLSTYFAFDSGSKYQHYFTASTGTIPLVTWNSGSICEIRECGPTAAGPTFSGPATFSDFIWADTNQTVDINLSGRLSSVRNLTISHTNTHTLTLKNSSGISTMTVSGDLTIQSNANFILTDGGSTTVSNIIVNVAGNFYQSGGSFTLTTSTTTTAIQGNGVLNVGGTFNFSLGTLNICASAANSAQANGTINITGVCNISGGTMNLCSSTTVGGGGLGILNASGNFVHTGGVVSKTSASNSGTINIIGTTAQTIESTSGFNAGNAINFNIIQTSVGLCTVAIGKTFKANNGTIISVARNSGNSGTDFNVPSTSILDMGPCTMIDDATFAGGVFSVSSGGTLITQHTGGIAQSSATGCVQVTGTRTFSSSANYTYNGTLAQITGDGLPSALVSPSILTINNSSSLTAAGITLSQATSTSGTLTLILGRFITTSSFLFTINSGGSSSSSGSINAFVDGPFKKIGATSFIFPIGDVYTATGSVLTAKWARIEISAPGSVTDAFIAEYHKKNDPCNLASGICVAGSYDAFLNHVSYKEYWELTRTSAAGVTPFVKLYWEDGSTISSPGSGISSLASADLRVAELIGGTGGTWTDKGSGIITGSAPGPGTIISNITTGFTTNAIMTFTFGANTVVNPLPIELLSFNGYSAVNGNQLNWITATETNNSYFELERGSDPASFSKITMINGAGNSASVKNYDYLDISPLSGINYYRLKQVDYNGEHTYSNVVAIDKNSEENTTVTVFPNPSNDIVNIIISSNITAVNIYDMLGNLVFSNAKEQQQNKIEFKPLSDGIYIIKAISTDGKVTSTRFVKN